MLDKIDPRTVFFLVLAVPVHWIDIDDMKKNILYHKKKSKIFEDEFFCSQKVFTRNGDWMTSENGPSRFNNEITKFIYNLKKVKQSSESKKKHKI